MMTLAFIILCLTILLFIWGKLRPDMVALLSTLALFLSGLIDIGEALQGFADNTVILIAVLFVVGEGISRTGIGVWLGHQLVQRSGSSHDRLLFLIMLGAAGLSAVISNTGTVAMMIPWLRTTATPRAKMKSLPLHLSASWLTIPIATAIRSRST